jgi:hypothetical protein
MTSTLQTQSNSSNVALEYAVTHNLPILVKWALEKPVSEKPTNIEYCLNLAFSKSLNEDIISLLVSQLNSPKIEDTNVKESIKEAPKEESKKEESKKEESKEDAKKKDIKEDLKEKYPLPLTLIKNDYDEINTSLIMHVEEDPEKALEELKKGRYSLEELNYQHEHRYMFTILHYLCYEKIQGKIYEEIYEEILEYLLTKTDININLLSSGKNTAFSLGLFGGSINFSDKIFKLFLEHPDFNHHFKFIQSSNIVTHLVNRYTPNTIRNNRLIILLLECPKTQFDTEHPITNIIRLCLYNDSKHQLLEDILKNPNIKINPANVFGISFNFKMIFFEKIFTMIAKSKRVLLNLSSTDGNNFNILSVKMKNTILKIYLEYYPMGIW